MDGSSVSRRSLLWACATAAVLIPGTAENAGTGAVPAPGEDLAEGTLIQVPELNRAMTYDSRIGDSAVVIGDSQTGPETWVARGLDALGYRTVLRGAGGTGYIRGTQRVGSYHQAADPAAVAAAMGTSAAGDPAGRRQRRRPGN